MACSSCGGGCSSCGDTPTGTTISPCANNWEIPVDNLPLVEDAERKYMYILPDDTCWVLNSAGDGYVELVTPNSAVWDTIDANAIIDVEELPSVDEASDSFYRLPDDTLWFVNSDGDTWIQNEGGGGSCEETNAVFEWTTLPFDTEWTNVVFENQYRNRPSINVFAMGGADATYSVEYNTELDSDETTIYTGINFIAAGVASVTCIQVMGRV